MVSGGNPSIEILSTNEEDFYNYTVREIINLPSVKVRFIKKWFNFRI